MARSKIRRGRAGRELSAKGKSGQLRLYGRHAVEAALDNPERHCRKLFVTADIAQKYHLPDDFIVERGDGAALARMVPEGAPHQGLVLECDPLEPVALDELWLGTDRKRPILVLDQVTDPHNVGAIIRSAAAFGAAGIVTQDRHSPPESGALAKAASGALERLPWARVTNLARALEDIGDAGYWRIGLAGEADMTLAAAQRDMPACLVLGAEGSGLRPNVAGHCDVTARLPISQAVESLNVSNAAAVALYEVGREG
ncbi:23S rRNA (guanosine(2251)-2'-O)-methyltransferase RlmB [Pacificimonas flava]|uniref:23S rRNA (Guanosine(2251)-2'-O)-methyltransferase RlmB n=2 Tax=Pacificimonas TaxID=1960290 RepID=A0A219B406_9SPHN|nr:MULTISPECIES: 23S rRNA (guanosine(2251)-2'-O)-methyltransferase RlmB [Pacificimonas]MBZ6377804.1 23S rRNA (guanosine(2251)-2'-O)-methyltransferase RlmB [Pacificimonas aurantium]OWV32528.1 23S rRNA (guanosine(2251)-2'-O)-methyltransferase RlmB [Pacificimonas flava]